ncbi:MAG: twin-arginine translocase TatA/TatE family subunit [Chloroflexi bacterium]|nr:twin-arginine translocase TatA/TatE family subunit [Chloroflexota bacterium]
MEFLGMGTLEILVVLLIAFAVFGPQRMVGIARGLGKFVRQISKVGSEVTKTLSEENLPAEGKQAVQDFKKIGTELRQTVADALKPVQDAAQQVTQPPAESVPVAQDAEKAGKAAVPERPAFSGPPPNNPAAEPAPQKTTESKTS